MKKKVYTKKSLFYMTRQTNKIVFWLLFAFFWVVILMNETNSIFWAFLFSSFSELFWEYYKWVFSPVAVIFALYLFKDNELHFDMYRLIWVLLYLSSISTIIGYFKTDYNAVFNLLPLLEISMWRNTTFFLFFIGFVFSLVILFKFSPIHFTKKVVSTLPKVSEIKESFQNDTKNMLGDVPKTKKNQESDKKQKEFDTMILSLKKEKELLEKMKYEKDKKAVQLWPKKIEIETGKSEFWKNKSWEKSETKFVEPKFPHWKLPSLELLKERLTTIKVDQNEIRRKEIEIQEKLLQFKIEVEMEWCKVGPTVIQYRLKPSEWVKLQKIENLKKDLTLALQAKSIRIQAPIPWLGVVGIEVPNDNRQAVGLKEIISSKEFNSPKNEIPIAVGKDVNGDIVVGDLVKMPHLLVAGQTASGKSVGMNGFLISMLYKFTPSELKLILVDPKRVELSVYNGIPHLLTPVITNPEKAINALKWAVAEMLRRYDLATSAKARNLKEYNDKMEKDKRLPYIVIVIDELADLMMSGNKKEVEGTIVRIAQMARAVGMHLIVATQRPSVDVITGLIKANIPSRIAFTVASQIDSRTVIDKAGAEDLLGRGDMLYNPTGVIDALRVQWVFVETDEVEAVVNQIKLTVDPDMMNNLYDESIVNGKSNFEGSILENYHWEQEESPEIIEKAIQIVKETRKWSTSLIQRKLGLGYARAAKVLDILEELWVVGPANGSKPRDVYVD